MAKSAASTSAIFSFFRSVKSTATPTEMGLASMFPKFVTGAPRTGTTSSKSSSRSGDEDVVKQAFSKQQLRFRTYLEEISKQKLDFDPMNEASVKTYFQAIAKIRKSLGVTSMTGKIAALLEGAAVESADVRTFMEQYRSFRIEVGIEDDMDADSMMFAALDRVEKNIKRRLSRDNGDGMSQLKKEFDQINQKLKLNESELGKMEEEAEWALAKAELHELQSVALNKMNTFKRRDDLKVDVDLKQLDYRTHL